MTNRIIKEDLIKYGNYILSDLKETPKPSEEYNEKRIKVQEQLLSTAKKYEEVVGYLIKAIETTPGTEGKVSFLDGKIDAYEEIYGLLTEEDK